MAMTNAERQRRFRERRAEREHQRADPGVRASLLDLAREIDRRRRANKEKQKTIRWNPDSVLKLEQKRLLDWIEEELSKLNDRLTGPAA